MAEALGVLVLLVGLLISIGLHELGHMIPAKKFGVRVSEYFVGFGPTLWSRHGKETEYGLKAIPLGGYVRLVGMVPPAERVKPVRVRGGLRNLIEDARATAVEDIREGEDHRAFYHLAWWKKVIVMFGGPLVNLVLAAILFTVALSGIGVATATLTVREVVPCVPASLSVPCTPEDPESPAVVSGLQTGDVVVAADGQPMATWGDLTEYVSARPGQQVNLSVLRAGDAMTIALTPAPTVREVYPEGPLGAPDITAEPTLETVGFMGLAPRSELKAQPLESGVVLTGAYMGAMVEVVVNLPSHLWDVSRAAVGLEERNPDGIVGVVGVGRIAADATADETEGFGFIEKVRFMLVLLGGLNLALFVFNMIPLVPLDGGHIASAVWQAIKNGWARLRGKSAPNPVDVARMMPVAYGVFAILLLMGLVLIYADIVAPITLG